MSKQYWLEDLVVRPIHQCSSRVKKGFKDWITGLTLAEDNEVGGEGPGTAWQWVLEQAYEISPDKPWNLFVFLDPQDTVNEGIVAGAAFVEDDSNVLQVNREVLKGRVSALGCLSLTVRRDLRSTNGHGGPDSGLSTLETIVLQYLDRFVRELVAMAGVGGNVYRIADDMTLYAGFGFTDSGISFSFGDHEEQLLVKEYKSTP